MCVEGILQLFTIFYLHRKFSIFLRNDCDCKAVENLDILRNYRDCKAVALKEYYDYSPISTYTERSQNFLRKDRDCKDVDLYKPIGPTARKSVQGCLLYHL